jgi:hypothetical protein
LGNFFEIIQITLCQDFVEKEDAWDPSQFLNQKTILKKEVSANAKTSKI